MPNVTPKNAAEKKAFELSYILIRVAERIRQKSLKEKIEAYAISLMENAAISNKAGVAESINVLEYLLHIGAEMGEIHDESVAVIIAELQKINTAIAGLGSVLPMPIDFKFDTARKKEIRQRVNKPQNGNRQEEILQIIRQKGTCRFKDIQEGLPDVSERTIRYDLGRMSEEGIIERVGAGGPDTFYRVREKSIQVVDNEPQPL
jgi:hypothetical protein